VTIKEALGLPDLALSRSDITFFNSSGQEIQQAADGEPVTIKARIHNININDTQAPVTVYVYDGEAVSENLIESVTITDVIEGDPQGRDETARTAAINWTAIGDTYKVITVKIGYGYPEATLQNNQASRLFVVGDPSGTFTITVDGNVSKSNPCYGTKISISGTATYEWLGIPVMGAHVDVEVWEYGEDGQLYSTAQGRTTAPYGNYSIPFDAPSQDIEYVIKTRVHDGFLTGMDYSDIILPDPCTESDMYDISCSYPTLGGDVFYIPCPGYSNTKTYTNSPVAVSGQITNAGNRDFPNPDGFDVTFHSGYPFTSGNLICSQRIDEVSYPEIAVGQSLPVSCPTDWSASTAGIYNIYMNINVNDRNSNNNQASRPIQVYAQRVDLRPYRYSGCSRVTGISFSKQCIIQGDEITIFCNLYNGGINSSGAFEVRFYSGDPDGCCGQQIGDPVTVQSIQGQGNAQAQVQWDTSQFEGGEEIFVKVDIPNAVSEYDENNNKTSASCYVCPTTADLYVGNVSFSNYAPNPGDLINIIARIDNNGGSVSGPTDVDFYVGDPAGNGVPMGVPVSVESIPPCGNVQVSLQGWEVPAPGTYYIYARLDNGRKNFRILQVYPLPQPDLRVYSEDILFSSGPHILGYPISFSAIVHNQSTVAAALNPGVSFYIGGISDEIGSSIAPSIAARGSVHVPCRNTWIPTIESFYEVGVLVEPVFPQADVNYANNFATTSFCVSSSQDPDSDNVFGICDNCPSIPNPAQQDSYPPQGNRCGDACECEGNFDGDLDVDGSDASNFKADFGRSIFNRRCTGADSCNGDFNCDGDVDGADASLFKADFGRSAFNNPCPDCATTPWCLY